MNKMAKRTCILIITLNLTGLNDLIKDNEWLKKKLPTRDALQIKRYTQTTNEVIEKHIPRKWRSKESWGSNTYSRRNRF